MYNDGMNALPDNQIVGAALVAVMGVYLVGLVA